MSDLTVDTTKGKVRATTGAGGVTAFKGIPYAAAPTGERRWAPPVDPALWTSVRSANEFGPACPQQVFESMEGTEPVVAMDEDCLHLNVWTTGGGSTAKKPVMVWIHGGAYKLGEGRSRMYDGTALAKLGAVVVTLNYRLGHLGFFAHPAFEREFPNGPINFGLLDQIHALKWVRDNIAGFGGDAHNVTIFGESAGADSVLALCAATPARGLFHKAIAQSSYALPEHSRAKAVAMGADIADRLFKLGPNPTIAQLRGVSADKFEQLVISPGVQVPSLGPSAVIDGVVLTGKIRDTFQSGGQATVPLMIGSNSDEQSVLTLFQMDPALILDMLEAKVGADSIAALKGLYKQDPEIEDEELEDRTRFGGLILRDLLFTMQGRWIGTQQAKKSHVYRYYFSYVAENLGEDYAHGVPHGGEIVYPFQTGNIAGWTENKFTAKVTVRATYVDNHTASRPRA